jgi:hypothetical protein
MAAHLGKLKTGKILGRFPNLGKEDYPTLYGRWNSAKHAEDLIGDHFSPAGQVCTIMP